MELKSYLQVLWRRWPVVLILPLLVGLLAGYQEVSRTEAYSASARLAVVRQPDPEPVDDFRYDEYYNYLTSEFKIDDLVEKLRGNVFSDAVAERLNASGANISSGDVQGAISTNREHRILSVTATTSDPERSLRIARAVIEELETNSAQYLNITDAGAGAFVQAIQVPHGTSTDTMQARIILILSVFVALGGGVLLAFLVDYLDDTLYDADGTTDALKMPLLAIVPAERSS